MVLYLQTCDMAGALTIDVRCVLCAQFMFMMVNVITEKMYVMVDDGGML